jgi:hypothetical protein
VEAGAGGHQKGAGVFVADASSVDLLSARTIAAFTDVASGSRQTRSSLTTWDRPTTSIG